MMNTNLSIKLLAVVSCKALVVGYAQYAGTFADLAVQPMAMHPSHLADVELSATAALVMREPHDDAPMAQKKALP
jgi:hypothetical protein